MTDITQRVICTCGRLIWPKTLFNHVFTKTDRPCQVKIRRNISGPTVMRDLFQRLLTFGFKINLPIAVCADLLAARRYTKFIYRHSSIRRIRQIKVVAILMDG